MNEECNEERKFPWTTAELFLKITENLKAKGFMPDILDYALPTSPQLKIMTEDFRVRNNLDYEKESSGIYLDVFLEFQNEDGTIEGKGLGTFRTSDSSSKAMHTMADLLGNFLIELKDFKDTHKSDFIWEGVSVYLYPCDGNGERLRVNLLCNDMKAALEMKDQLLEKYDMIEVRDNKTRKAVVYER